MPDYRRTGYAPWSLTREAGVQSATVDGTIEVDQYLQPVINTGFVDEKGNWQGQKSSDEQFIGITKAEGVANGAQALFPDTSNFNHIDMTGFNDLFFAFKPSRAGNYAFKSVFGPDTVSFANLSPVNTGTVLRGAYNPGSEELNSLLLDGSDSVSADVWTIYFISSRLRAQKNMQIEIVNNAGGTSNMEFGFMRLL